MIDLEELAYEINNTASSNGFWETERQPAELFPFYAYKLGMIHSEVTEVLEALRKRKGSHEVVEEIADILIRVLDLYVGLYVDKEIDREDFKLEKILRDKVDYNKTRPVKHGVRG